MTKGIYCYVDKKDNQIIYIGKDSHIEENERHKEHLKPSTYDKQPINKILQNNPDRYTYQILVWDVEDENTLNALEIQYIRQLNTYHYNNPRGFNFTEGGDGKTGFKPSEESRKRMSEAQKGKKNHFYGKHHSEETKKKMRENLPDVSGKNNPQAKYTLWNISYIYYGKNIMFRYGRKPNPIKCFYTKYQNYRLGIGFHDFVSCEILNNLIKDALNKN